MKEIPEFEVGDLIHCIRSAWYDEGDLYTVKEKVYDPMIASHMYFVVDDDRPMGWVNPKHFVKFKDYEKLPSASSEKKHNHYFKYCPYEYIDVYRVSRLFEVNDAALDHALKKILCSGGRGVKDRVQDIEEAIDTLNRWLELEKEERLVT